MLRPLRPILYALPVYGLGWLCSLMLDHPRRILLIGLAYGAGVVAAFYIAVRRSVKGKEADIAAANTGAKPVLYVMLICTIAISGWLLNDAWPLYRHYRVLPIIAAGMIYLPGLMIGAALAGMFCVWRGLKR